MGIRAAVLAGFLVYGAPCNGGRSAPIEPVKSSKHGVEESKVQAPDTLPSLLFKRALARLLSQDEFNQDDPCLKESKELWETLKADQGSEAETEARTVLQDCQDGLSDDELKASMANFHILESKTTYEKVCGGKSEETCRELQEKVKKVMDGYAMEGWNYSDWAWSYDENGQAKDAAAFPGYQAYIPDPNGSHEDLWSIIAYGTTSHAEAYQFGIACGMNEELTPINTSGQRAFSTPEALVYEMQQLMDYHPVGD